VEEVVVEEVVVEEEAVAVEVAVDFRSDSAAVMRLARSAKRDRVS
jgi:hypothetical protein